MALLFTGADDVLVIRTGAGEMTVPMVRDVVKEIDTGRGEITIDFAPGPER